MATHSRSLPALKIRDREACWSLIYGGGTELEWLQQLSSSSSSYIKSLFFSNPKAFFLYLISGRWHLSIVMYTIFYLFTCALYHGLYKNASNVVIVGILLQQSASCFFFFLLFFFSQLQDFLFGGGSKIFKKPLPVQALYIFTVFSSNETKSVSIRDFTWILILF